MVVICVVGLYTRNFQTSNPKRRIRLSTSRREPILATKSIRFKYVASQGLEELFNRFRLACNDAIRIALENKPQGRFQLIEMAYSHLGKYGLHTHYILSACEVAFSIFRNKHRKSQPCLRRTFLKLDAQTYRLNHLVLRIPTGPRQFIFLTLQASQYHMSFLNDPNLKRGEITITNDVVVIPFTREINELETRGQMGIDVNEQNVTWSDTAGCSKIHSELSLVVETKERYREIRAEISKNTHRDKRIQQRLLTKYGRREKNRTTQLVHIVSKAITKHAKWNRLGIRMENLKGIRKLYRKGNGQSTSFRGRMNSWMFYETQRQVDYKGKWEGIPIVYVNPRGSSSNCPDCGSRVVSLADRKLYCPRCDRTWDRDDLASKNLMAAPLVRAVRPPRWSSDEERSEDGSNPLSRRVEVRQVEGVVEH